MRFLQHSQPKVPQPRLEPPDAARNHPSMFKRGAFVLLVAISACACSLFHRETPQQKMLDALNRGNAAEASHIWQEMSQKDRMKFNRGQGFTPAVSPEQTAKMLTEMPPGEMPNQVTIQAPNAGGTLLELPRLANPQQAAPAPPAVVPAPDASPEQP